MTEEFFRTMEAYNPFYFRDERERFCVFKDYAQLYLSMLERLYKQAPAGYIDLVLFVVWNVHLDKKGAEQFLENFYRSGALDPKTSQGLEGICFVNWKEIDSYRQLLERIATGLHWVSETKFNKSMFNSGYNQFKLKMKLFV